MRRSRNRFDRRSPNGLVRRSPNGLDRRSPNGLVRRSPNALDRRSPNGFTLLETVIMLAGLSVGFASLMWLSSEVGRRNLEAREVAAATLLAHNPAPRSRTAAAWRARPARSMQTARAHPPAGTASPGTSSRTFRRWG